MLPYHVISHQVALELVNEINRFPPEFTQNAFVQNLINILLSQGGEFPRAFLANLLAAITLLRQAYNRR